MKRAILLIIILFSSTIFSQKKEVINEIIKKVSIDTLMNNLSILTGDKETSFGGGNIRITSRHRNSLGNTYALQYLKRKFEKIGLPVYQQDFLNDGQNIYAIQKGIKKPNQYVIICAHYDCMPFGDFAPGADDNGSGTIAVLEAARILSKYQFNYSIIYALFDLEEQGLLGSSYYAQQASMRKDSIIAVINLDMIGWDSNNDYAAEVHVQDVVNSIHLAQVFHDSNKNYEIGIKLFTNYPGSTASDHASFWRNGFTAAMLIESFKDFNFYYHQTSDDISKINKDFYEKMTKLAISVLSEYAGTEKDVEEIKTTPTAFYLSFNYPNPFNNSTKIRYNLSQETYTRLIVYDALGNEVFKLVDGIQKPNYYEINFDERFTKKLSSGVYFYSLQAGNYFAVRKMILTK
ncbi:MAG: M28 family peptidase [Melioribacteraceae bacterium]|nr:M28 family peptidase [Melioribacteraceae bacterium]